MIEEWKDVWYQGKITDYQVSTGGHVRSLKRQFPLILTPAKAGDGYLNVTIYQGTLKRSIPIHRLVANAFLGIAPGPNYQVAHNNGNLLNNTVNNLRWATPVENQGDRSVHGTDNKGIRNGEAKLQEHEVRAIRDEFAKGYGTKRGIAKRYNVSDTLVRFIVQRKAWTHID